ncbi:MAG: hypothetical protein IT452_06680 [Planctomycetia bacterium]|nr:hypothetical protein [Planctomycetia bacterium]
MRTALLASFAGLLVSLPVFAGGPRCEVAWTSPATPGFEPLAMGGGKEAAPKELRLTERQVDALVKVVRELNDAKAELDAKAAKLPLSKGGTTQRGELTDRVTVLVAKATRDAVLVVDPETAGLFHLARKAAMEDPKLYACDLCIAVRRGVEAKWAWDRAEFARELTAEEEKLAAEVAAGRQALREKWAAALRAELTKEQLAWLAAAQEEWIAAETGRCVEAGFRAAGREVCEACSERRAKKCRLCDVVTSAVQRAVRE